MADFWKKHGREYPTLHKDIKCRAAVIGGGLTGVLLASRLAERGIDTALFDAGRIGGGKTARSTAKVTLAHGTAYSDIARRVSTEAAKKYAAANMAGLEYVVSLEGEESRRDMYLYAMYGERKLRRELDVMLECGIDAEHVAGADLPLPVGSVGAIRLRDQLAIDPVQLCERLCEAGHFKIYENSPAEHVERHGFTCAGHRVHADFVAVCTNYPVRVPHSGSPLKLSRKSSVAVAFRSAVGFPMDDVMAFGVDGGYGYRYAEREGERVLIVSGETGRCVPPGAVERIVGTVQRFAPEAEVVTSWVNNDTYTHDGIPYAGELAGGIYVACGYSAWGMTNAAAAAVILENRILGHNLWYDDVFSPRRNFLRGGAAEFAEHVCVTARGEVKNLASPPDRYVSSVREGEAAIVNHHGRRVGAYREDGGEVHLVSLKCPHLGCSLEWNDVDKTWDCPCHGSRFSYRGECISNPAERGIAID